MRPSEGDTNYCNGKKNGGEQVSECWPPARQYKPDQIPDKPEKSSSHIINAGKFGPRYSRLPKRKKRVQRDVEGCARPRQSNDRYPHNDSGDYPGDRKQSKARSAKTRISTSATVHCES